MFVWFRGQIYGEAPISVSTPEAVLYHIVLHGIILYRSAWCQISKTFLISGDIRLKKTFKKHILLAI